MFGTDTFGELAFGESSGDSTPTLSPTGIASEEVFGTLTFTIDNINFDLTGIPSDEAFGTPALPGILSSMSIPSDEAFGTASVIWNIAPSGIASAGAVGTPYTGTPVYYLPVSRLVQ